MEPAVFIARLAGPFFVVVGAGLLVNRGFYLGLVGEVVRSPALVYFSGLMSLLPGLAILNVHRAWTSDWRVVVTVLGWLLTIGGFIRIVLPRVTVSLATAIYNGTAAIVIVALISLALGVFLTFKAYTR